MNVVHGLPDGRCEHSLISLLRKTKLVFVQFVIVLLCCAGCQRQNNEPVTITLIDQGWLTTDFQDKRNDVLQQFMRETGIQVKVLPTPESSLDQLAFWKQLLASGSQSPDVYGVDVIWPGELAPYLLDLEPYLGKEAAAHFPALVDKYRVNGKLVAMPYHANVGVLFCRKDLLRKYGYAEPPRTFAELEKMAGRIQRGERAGGNKNFWGFVWQGEAAEGLTCNALEWQAAAGGGQIIEPDGTVSVNNPEAIKAWDQAASWVGTISPPGVVAYRESDANNVWLQGEAAFMRNWTPGYGASQAPGSRIADKVQLTRLPSDAQGRAGTLGGSGLGVSRFSSHPQQAIALVRFLCRKDIELKWARVFSEPPTLPELYQSPELLAANPYLRGIEPSFEGQALMRPSQVAGDKYTQVSTAYFEAIHAVLVKKQTASQAAAELEKQLNEILGSKRRDSGHPRGQK
jgi:trehalose/maltose transport system substrate-binding protein